MNSRKISNQEFEEALKNNDNRLIMEKACSNFRKKIDPDELHRCKLIALWEAMTCWNPAGRKFTSFLYQRVSWECLKTVNKMNKHPSYPLLYEKESTQHDSIKELIEILPEDMQEMMLHRYVHRMTLREIGKKYGCCAESVRRKIKKAVEILKTEYNTMDIGL